jgi:DNA-binding response OmpR family regulator
MMMTGPMARLAGRILIADDEEPLLEIASARLAFVAEDVRVARDGAEAWRMIEREPPDVLVTDLMMPGLSGEELCVKVRESEQGKNIWILILTARRGTRQRVQGLDLGADDYLEKPFDLDELAARVRTGLRIRALQRELQSVARHEAIGWVAYALGHEIRNPLAVILANASVQSEHSLVLAELGRAASRAQRTLEGLGAEDEAAALGAAASRQGGVPAVVAEMREVAEANARLARRAAAAVSALQRFAEGASGALTGCDPLVLVEDAIRLAFAGAATMPEVETAGADLPSVLCVPRDVVLALATALNRAAPPERRAHGELSHVHAIAMPRGVVLRIEGPGDGTPPSDLVNARIAEHAPGEHRSGLDVGLAHAVVALRASGAGLSVGPREDGGVIIEVVLPVAEKRTANAKNAS